MAKTGLVQSFRRPGVTLNPEDVMKAFVTGDAVTNEPLEEPAREGAPSAEMNLGASEDEDRMAIAHDTESDGAPPESREHSVVPKAANRKGMVRRADGSQFRRVTVYLEPDIAKALFDYCYTHDLEVSTVSREAMLKGLSKLLPGRLRAEKQAAPAKSTKRLPVRNG